MDKEKEKIIEKAGELCNEYRDKGFHCSESTIRAVADVLDIKLPEDLLRVSSVFRGGGGGYGERCGAVEAGLMLISYLYGRTDPEQDVSDYSYLARLLHDRYKEELGSYYCRVLLPFAYYLSGEEQHCGYVYRNGAKIVARLLLEADELIANMPEEEKAGYGEEDEKEKETKVNEKLKDDEQKYSDHKIKNG
ncbi:MAG: C-GCAxxG-C-C family protein [Bacillota bacterium]|nr:C-GCAxxG-C-C family protein [Bacillota bacterium]